MPRWVRICDAAAARASLTATCFAIVGPLLTGTGAGGCVVRPPEPELVRVAPPWAVDDEPMEIRVFGQNLLPRAQLRASDGSVDADVGAFSVTLVSADDGAEFPLPDATVVARDELRTLVFGVPVGEYDVVVTTPWSQTATLADGFEVLDVRADALRIELDAISWQAGTEARFQVQLLDPSGLPMAADMGVQVTITPDEALAPEVVFAGGALEGQQELPDVAGIVGRLGSDGMAEIAVTVSTPDQYTLNVRPLSEGAVGADDARVDVFSGDVTGVRVRLPSEDFVAVAGEPFEVTIELIDNNGLVVTDTRRSLAVGNACGKLFAAVEVAGPQRTEITLEVATTPEECPFDEILVTGFNLAQGRSTPIVVLPAEVSQFEVEVSDPVPGPGKPRVVAGTELDILVTPADAYGNSAPWAGTVGAVVDGAGNPLLFRCSAGAPQYCTARVTRAVEDDVITVYDASGVLEGVSNRFDVTPGAAITGIATADAAVWRAGDIHEVRATVFDYWANVVDPATAQLLGVTASNRNGDAQCSVAVDGMEFVLQCVSTRAAPNSAIVLSVPSFALEVTSAPFSVHNGELARLEVVASDLDVIAGEEIDAMLYAWDAWNNPYTVQAISVVEVPDSTGTISPDGVELEPDGSARFDLVLTRAGLWSVMFRAGEISTVAPTVSVRAGDGVELRVQPDRAWTSVGTPMNVTVEVLDAYGNRAETRQFGTLSSVNPAVPSPSFMTSNGLAVVPMEWNVVVANEALRAVSAQLEGVGPPMTIFSTCVRGPTPVVDLGGVVDGVLCGRGPDEPIRASSSLRRSVASPGTILRSYGLRVAGTDLQAGVVSTGPEFSPEIPGHGAYAVEALVVQTDGCGAVERKTLFVGPDDGSVVGPIEVTPTLDLLDPLGGAVTTAVSITDARTCAGTVAGNVDLFVRTDRGTLLRTQRASNGLNVTLDATGSAIFELSSFGVGTGGVASVTAVAPRGVALGVAEVEIDVDTVPPTVWRQTPKGWIDGPVSEVSLQFSEAIDPATLGAGSFELNGLAVRIINFALSPDLREATLEVGPAFTAGGDSWILVLNSQVADFAGNRLAGTWSSQPAAYSGVIGGGQPPGSAVSCGISHAQFRPDGADGVGVEADQVTFSFSADTSPSWWVVSVEDPKTEETVRVEYLAPVGASDNWTWDGRDVTERIVDPGVWRVRVVAEDNTGDWSTDCVELVEVTQWGAGR
jgi:hypothetical protein